MFHSFSAQFTRMPYANLCETICPFAKSNHQLSLTTKMRGYFSLQMYDELPFGPVNLETFLIENLVNNWNYLMMCGQFPDGLYSEGMLSIKMMKHAVAIDILKIKSWSCSCTYPGIIRKKIAFRCWVLALYSHSMRIDIIDSSIRLVLFLSIHHCWKSSATTTVTILRIGVCACVLFVFTYCTRSA